MKIVIITDGNNKLGMGHVYQSKTLVNYLLDKDEQLDISFMTKSDENIINLLEDTNCDVFSHLNDDSIFKQLTIDNPDKIIFDKLDVAPELAQRIKEDLKAELFIFTNLTSANDYADMTVMAGMGSDFKNICIENNNKIKLVGPKYWIIRPEFFKYSNSKDFNNHEVVNILLQFGGSDQENLSTSVLKKILEISHSFSVSIILGSSFTHYKQLDDFINQNDIKVKILKNVIDVAKIMHANDLVFVSPGLSFFEALSIGTPVLCFHQNDFQKNAWKGLIPTYGKEELNKLPLLLKEKKFIYPNDQFILDMEVGLGKDFIVSKILN